jgi:hypothetical protein
MSECNKSWSDLQRYDRARTSKIQRTRLFEFCRLADRILRPTADSWCSRSPCKGRETTSRERKTNDSRAEKSDKTFSFVQRTWRTTWSISVPLPGARAGMPRSPLTPKCPSTSSLKTLLWERHGLEQSQERIRSHLSIHISAVFTLRNSTTSAKVRTTRTGGRSRGQTRTWICANSFSVPQSSHLHVNSICSKKKWGNHQWQTIYSGTELIKFEHWFTGCLHGHFCIQFPAQSGTQFNLWSFFGKNHLHNCSWNCTRVDGTTLPISDDGFRGVWPPP